MPLDPAIDALLRQPGLFAGPRNLAALADPAGFSGSSRRLPSGHLVLYGSHGRRILLTDPDGFPLHECEWVEANGRWMLARARVHLDWGAWVGLAPNGLINRTQLDLSRNPGRQRLQTDDLRAMAAQALHVPLEEVRFFYTDEDLRIDSKGIATIVHRKDAILWLRDGTFERPEFMACMGAMHWEAIDFLPVVELFLSLLPGSGSAIFELIRGLYDDQQEGRPAPRPLRYRGIPTYPSEAAYRLFSAFFRPQLQEGGDPFPVFMDAPQSHRVTWLPVDPAPLRFRAAAHRLCVTIQGPRILKATVADDPAGLSYQSIDARGFAPCRRGLAVEQGQLLLLDRGTERRLPMERAWGNPTEPQAKQLKAVVADWTQVFGEAPPTVEPREAFGAVLLYPDDDREIGELSTQPFVADYLQDLIEQDRLSASMAARAGRVLIDGFDAAVTTCIGQDRPRVYDIRYDHPAYAQRQAQQLWNHWARIQRLDWLRHVRMLPRHGSTVLAPDAPYELAYYWVPFESYDRPDQLRSNMEGLAAALQAQGVAFVVGPMSAVDDCRALGLQLQSIAAVETLPTFRMHRSLVPRARLKPSVTLFQVAAPATGRS